LKNRRLYLEGKIEEHSQGFVQIRDIMVHLDQKVDRFREELSTRIDPLDVRLNARMDALDENFSRFFLWTIGIQVTILLAVIGTLLAK